MHFQGLDEGRKNERAGVKKGGRENEGDVIARK